MSQWRSLRSPRRPPASSFARSGEPRSCTGARGRGPLDLAAAAAALAALSYVAAERPEIAEIEINPLLVTADGALGLDARIVLAKGETDAR